MSLTPNAPTKIDQAPHVAPRARNVHRGVALIEFALTLPFLIILVMGTIDIGRLVQSRIIISNVSREGGSIAARQVTIDNGLATLLQASAKPLDLAGADGKVIVTRVRAGTDNTAANKNPKIEPPVSAGGLAVTSSVAANATSLGLPTTIYNWMVFNRAPAVNTTVISEVTVVEVFYLYRPITPLPNFVAGMLLRDMGGTGMILKSKATF